MNKFVKIQSLDLDGKKVVYQGVEGAYSQVAMKKYFQNGIDYFNVKTWREAFEALKNGEADYAVLPIENSTAGIVAENFDLLTEFGYYIVGEQLVYIDHCLLGVEGTDISGIKKVYSHPQALTQCTHFFEDHKNIEAVPVSNTAVAAEKVMKDGDKTQAAIAGIQAAEIYGLTVLQKAIQNNRVNQTRFIVVGKEPVFVEGADKISISLQLKHKPGALYHALSYFYDNGLNMTSITSRPIPDWNWEYLFYIDIEGSLEDEAVKTALSGLKNETKMLEIYGNYKMGIYKY